MTFRKTVVKLVVCPTLAANKAGSRDPMGARPGLWTILTAEEETDIKIVLVYGGWRYPSLNGSCTSAFESYVAAVPFLRTLRTTLGSVIH